MALKFHRTLGSSRAATPDPPPWLRAPCAPRGKSSLGAAGFIVNSVRLIVISVKVMVLVSRVIVISVRGIIILVGGIVIV